MTARELAQFCMSYETYQLGGLSPSALENTLGVLLSKGRIIWADDAYGVLAGYAEVWRIGYEQLGRIVCKDVFDVGAEDISTGPVCLLENVTIRPDCRQKGTVYRNLREQFYEQNQDASIFCGHARRKSVGLWKTFRNLGHCERNLSHSLAI